MYTTQGCAWGGSNTWGAYITKSDTVVQQETMSRERGEKNRQNNTEI